MTPLNWQEAPQKGSSPTSHHAPAPKGVLGFIVGIMSGAAFSLFLMGIIVGYAVGSWQSGRLFAAGGQPSQIAQIPSAPTPAPQAPQQPPEPTSTDNLPTIDPKKDHIRGDFSKATVAVVEYSDFECPFCQRHHPTMKQIMDTYKDDVIWVYRHFPLSFHANAQKEAEASECANELGGNDAFWKYTDAIFERTSAGGTGFPLANLVPLAKELGLDEAKFKSCLDSGKYAQHVQEDMAGGSQAGVNGTPGNIVVNLKTDENRIISGAVPFASFKTAIDALLGSNAAAQAPSGSARTIKMTAELWKFTPSVVRVKQGEKVTLEVTGVSGTHGIAIPGLGINETVIQGQTVDIDIPTDKTGTFDFRCSIQCGSGHNDMTGQVIVEA